MIKIKTIYDELKPEYKTELNANARKYSSAKRLKYTLMSKTIWQDLTMSEVSTMTTYCDVLTYKFSAQDIMYGKAFLKDLQSAGIDFQGVIKEEDLPTGCCNILVSPDGERTMATHIGIGSQLHPDEVSVDTLKDIDHVYMESYLWDHDLTKQTLQKVGEIAKAQNIETSLSLSDPFCVDRHRDELKKFVEDYVDIVFCNFDEAKMFSECESMADVSAYLQNFSKKIVMTVGAEGAYYFEGDNTVYQPATKVDNVIDTTGAGDNFAAGFLDFYLSDKSIQEALSQGNHKASQVIQQLGPRIKRH